MVHVQGCDRLTPKHYDKPIKPIDVVQAWGLNFSLGNVLKYICRHKEVGGIHDLRKALWYLQWEIERWERLQNEVPEKI